ncbi:MAG: alpha/beta fold hydrolase [Betaproteobacteria bacterium]|jgi:pimeloyl-ACP methyl ester carboxylesterase
MPTVNLPSGAVHYVESGQGVPLVLLHANPGDSSDFEAVVPALSRHYRVLALDWPGYGRSAVPSQHEVVNAHLFCNVLREFLNALALPPALFIGNSLGGNAAARLAIELPEAVRGLVLVSPGGFTPHNSITRAFCKFQGSRFAFSPRLLAGRYLKHRTPSVKAMLDRAEASQATAARIAVNRAVWRSFIEPEHDLRQSAGSIKAPTLLLFGKHDPVIPAKRDGAVAARCIQGAQLVVMLSGHAPFAEIPEAFLAEVLPFLARCMSARPGAQADAQKQRAG